MPTYEYTCKTHGVFHAQAHLSEFDAPQPCPICNKPAPRNLIAAPLIATNGQTSPKAQKGGHKGRKVKHAPGCPCCS